MFAKVTKMHSLTALYGNVQLKRVYCFNCESYSFVVDNRLTCCGQKFEDVPKKTKRMSEAYFNRRMPRKSEQIRILERQNNTCIYCDKPFGAKYIKNNKIYTTHIEYDHFIPFSYSGNNYPHNFVASCNVCNRLKESMMFQTLDEAKLYIANKRKEKGYD